MARANAAEALSRSDPAPQPTPAPEPAAPAADEWAARFFVNLYWRPDAPFILNKTRIKAVMDRAGVTSLLEPEELDVVRAADARWDRALNELSELGHQAVRNRISAIVQANLEKVDRGECPDPEPLPEKLEAEFTVRRKQLRGELKAAGVAVIPIFDRACARLAAAARAVAEELDAQEREAAAEFAVEFEPSPQLRAVVAVARYAQSQTRAFVPGTTGDPSRFLFGLVTG